MSPARKKVSEITLPLAMMAVGVAIITAGCYAIVLIPEFESRWMLSAAATAIGSLVGLIGFVIACQRRL